MSEATKNPRVLYLHPRSWTGDRFLLSGLQAMGFEVCVLEENRQHLLRRSDQTTDYMAQDGIPTLWYHPQKHWAKYLFAPFDMLLKRGFDGRALLHRMAMILYAVKRFKPDLIYCGDGFTYALPSGLLRRLKLLHIPVIAQCIGGDVLDVPEAEVGKRRQGLTYTLMRSALPYLDRVRAISPLIAAQLTQHFGVQASKIFILPNHMPLTESQWTQLVTERDAIREKIRQQYQLPNDSQICVTLSGNQKGKGIHLLAALWPSLVNQHRDLYWLLCGPENTWFNQTVRPQIQAGIDAGRIILTGALTQEAVYEHYAAGDLFINPTLADGLNMTVVEAALMGLPTVCSTHAGIEHWVSKYHAGWLADPKEPDAFLKQIQLALNRAEREAMTQGLTLMANEFFPATIFRQLKAELDHACHPSNIPSKR